ncbi:MAG: LeuA family protein [Candidatus Woesearchaeota archaeon]
MGTSSNAGKEQNRVRIFDTTLRDGMQTPGLAASKCQRVTLAENIASLNPNVMEIGMPANPKDYDLIPDIARAIYDVNPNVAVAMLCRSRDVDFERFEMLAQDMPNKKVLHFYVPISDILMKNSVSMGKSEVLDVVAKYADLAVSKGYDVEFSGEDAAATADFDFLYKVYEKAYASGCNVLNVPDTTGWVASRDYGDRIASLVQAFPDAVLSTHCHNDAGLAIANSLTAVTYGARQVEGTVLGLGERAGNADWLVLACALYAQKESIAPVCNYTSFTDVVKDVAQTLDIGIPFNYPIFGQNAFRTESGGHTNAILKDKSSYYRLDPSFVGTTDELVIGKTSGKHVVADRLQRLGVTVSSLDNVVAKALDYCMEHGSIPDEVLKSYC